LNELTALIERIQQGETEAYTPVIEQFQDMAVGYAYAVLGDLVLAEDVAQEAFIAAYYTIASRREPAAFPGWFRRIVQTQINRVKRRRAPLMVPLAEAEMISAPELEPYLYLERQLLSDEVTQAIQALPQSQRHVITLFYMGEYSQQEISEYWILLRLPRMGSGWPFAWLRLVRQKIATRPSQPVGSIPLARDPHSNAVAWQRRYCSLG